MGTMSVVGTGAPSTLRAHVVRLLKADILSGRYRPGERLNESRIARELKISRIPVREALSQLTEQGLVMSRERRGTFVIHLSDAEVMQIGALRILLETEALHLARRHVTPAMLASLKALVEKMEGWEGSLMEGAALDQEFHRLIWRASGNPFLQRALESLTAPLFAHKALEQISQEVRRWRMGHHRTFIEAITGDIDPHGTVMAHLSMCYGKVERFSGDGAAAEPPRP